MVWYAHTCLSVQAIFDFRAHVMLQALLMIFCAKQWALAKVNLIAAKHALNVLCCHLYWCPTTQSSGVHWSPMTPEDAD